MFRLNDAFVIAFAKGKNVTKKQIAARLWPDAPEASRGINMARLCSGKTLKIDPAWVPIICEELECTPAFLFGMGD